MPLAVETNSATPIPIACERSESVVSGVAPALLRVGLKPEGLEEPSIGGRDAGGGAPLREGQQPKSQEPRQKSERQEKEEEEFERVEHDSIP